MVANEIRAEKKNALAILVRQAAKSLYSLDYYCAFIWTKECARYLKELIEFREKKEGNNREHQNRIACSYIDNKW